MESLKNLFKRLQVAGFSKQDILDALPDWWKAEMVTDEDLSYEAMLDIAKNLGLDRIQVLNPTCQIVEY